MAKYPFLSEDWFGEVRRLHEAYDDAGLVEAIRMNLTVTESPFGEETPIHMASQGGGVEWGMGHLDDPDVTLTLGYATAREIFVGGNPQAAIEAFMAGRITVQGDIAKLVAMQATQPGAGTPGLARAVREITE